VKREGPKRRKKGKAALVIVLVSVIGLTAVGLFLIRANGEKPPEETVFVVREEVYRNTIEISGNIKAAQQQNIQAAGDGRVERVYVKEGDWVKAGQLLFQLDDSQERYNLASHDFQMNQERINGISARLDLMEEQRTVILRQIRDRRLDARFDGIIGQLNLAVGDYVKAQDTFGYLIDRSHLRATVEVVETDAPRLMAGQKVSLSFPAYPDLAVEGVVVSFPAVGRIASRGATVLDTEIRIDAPPDEILPGYSFTGEIIGSPEERVLTVEAAAIAYENGRAYAERLAGGNDGAEALPPLPAGTERVLVDVVPYGRNMVRVLAGLEPGDRLRPQAGESSFGQRRGSSRTATRVGIF
jgi:multidrug efflux pump subunit AcrA (membrane-fusion protein)